MKYTPWAVTLIMCLFLNCLTGYGQTSSDTTKIILNEHEARTLLKMAEIFWLQRKAITDLQAHQALMKAELQSAQLAAASIQAQIDKLQADNAWLQDTIAKWREQEQELVKNYDERLELERKKNRHRLLIFTAGGIAAGVILGLIAK